MTFKAYDLLSSVIPGFVSLVVLLNFLGKSYDKDQILLYTVLSFFLGYLVNTLGSWLEDFYFISWGGKPSNNLLSGKDIWKVKFYHSERAKTLLRAETANAEPSNDELFAIAMRSVTATKDSRVEDFNGMYAFSRALLTTVLIGTIMLLWQHGWDWRYYAVLIPTLLITWLRCKQRGYYYAREVLNEYLKSRRQ